MVNANNPIEDSIDFHNVAYKKSKGGRFFDLKDLQQLEEEFKVTLKQRKSLPLESQRNNIQENDDGSWANDLPKQRKSLILESQRNTIQENDDGSWANDLPKQRKSLTLESQCNTIQENDDGSWANDLPRSEFSTHHIEETMVQSSSNPPEMDSNNMATHFKTIPIEETCYNEKFRQSQEKYSLKDFSEAKKKIPNRTSSKCLVEIPRLEMTKVKEIALQAKLESEAYVCQECQIVVATTY
ncbi:hypothetical protein KC19_4G066800 [Ceratodon purpureus]|uniref:Uncharacterized protein n=1 Tax=Ceratodon purpureus TaxID=3225 RepID=A0A8T0I7J6_CERPU|nr:hypothetical protein KC19_4G066800 [Ceratodon purpureus]